MKENIYTGYFIDKSIKDRHFFEGVQVTNRKKIWLGLIAILEVKVSEEMLPSFLNTIQNNLRTRIGLLKQEFYVHFYCEEELLVVFRKKVFRLTSDKSTWTNAISYGISLGIAKKQLDFLTPDENQIKYFS